MTDVILVGMIVTEDHQEKNVGVVGEIESEIGIGMVVDGEVLEMTEDHVKTVTHGEVVQVMIGDHQERTPGEEVVNQEALHQRLIDSVNEKIVTVIQLHVALMLKNQKVMAGQLSEDKFGIQINYYSIEIFIFIIENHRFIPLCLIQYFQ